MAKEAVAGERPAGDSALVAPRVIVALIVLPLVLQVVTANNVLLVESGAFEGVVALRLLGGADILGVAE
ncbi:hypothetical protein D9M68_977670 [compost metagenome]